MKKFILILFCVIVFVNGEPPRGRIRNFQSKFKFPSDRLIVPARQEQPKPIYGPPAANQPSHGYLPPEQGVNNEASSGVYLPPSRQIDLIENLNIQQIRPDVEQFNIRNNKLRNAEGQSYFIYHPNGLLEKVTYSPTNNLQTVAVTAPLRDGNTRIITEPIFTYDPVNFAVQRLQ